MAYFVEEWKLLLIFNFTIFFIWKKNYMCVRKATWLLNVLSLIKTNSSKKKTYLILNLHFSLV
jgi:hypothetical protein